MVSAVGVQTQKIGTCPHGLPFGACPICNGMGGGGGAAKKADFSAKPGEMSWAECYAIGQMLKAQKLNAAMDKAEVQNFGASIANFQKAMTGIVRQIGAFMQRTLPAPVYKALSSIFKNVVLPAFSALKAAVNLLQDLQLKVSTAINTLKQVFTDISDKLAMIYGELKNAIDEKISKPLKRLARKLFAALGIFAQEEDDSMYDKHIERFAEKETIKKTGMNFYNNKEEIEDDADTAA